MHTKTGEKIDLYTKIGKGEKKHEEKENNRETKGRTNVIRNKGIVWIICTVLAAYIAWLQYKIQTEDNNEYKDH